MYDLMVKTLFSFYYHAREEEGGDFGSGLSVGVMGLGVALLPCINLITVHGKDA
jgi:hypothetical protein